jgi:hypothetical protein
LSETAPSLTSTGRFVDTSPASFWAAYNPCTAATQVGPWSCRISRPSSRKQSRSVGYLLDLWTDLTYFTSQSPCEEDAEHLRLT